MCLHLGQDTVVKEKDVIGIFDLDTSTVSKSTRDFLTKAQKNNEVYTVSSELPKSFVVASAKGKNIQKIYISQLSSSTLQKRSNSKISE